jgi:hypothetical protein
MPGTQLPCVQSRRGLSAFRVSFFSIPVFAALAACNGQTPFAEQSRILEAEVQVASSDADAWQQRSGRANPELPAVRDERGMPQFPSSDSSINRPASGLDEWARVGGGAPPVLVEPGAGPDTVVNRPGRSPDETGGMPPDVQVPPVDPEPPTVGDAPAPNPLPDKRDDPVQQPQAPSEPRPGEMVFVDLTQPRAKVDILWVVDNSGSMAWAQNQLKSKFQSFAKKLQDTRVDFQVGVTSLDVCSVDDRTGYPVPDALCPNSNYIADGAIVANKVIGPLRGALQKDKETDRAILTDTPDFVQSFQRTALLGTKGSAFEHGLWAARLAVEKSMSSDGTNRGFVRKDASLSIIVLSDEEDDSVQMWCEDGYGRTSTTPNGDKDLSLCREGGRSPYLDAFGIAPYALMKDSKGRPITQHKYTADDFKAWVSRAGVKGSGNTRVSAITGLRNDSGVIDCGRTTNGPEESGTSYIKAAQITGGAIENICSSDWSSVLENVGQNTVELATKVSLPKGQIPFPGTLKVLVDGVEASIDSFSYDSMLHAIVFKVPPAMGAVVSVSYNETLVD